MSTVYQDILAAIAVKKKLLAVLIDPEKYTIDTLRTLLKNLPEQTTHLFIGGSTATNEETQALAVALKKHSSLPVVLFPGSSEQLVKHVDAVLFLTLLSGRNPEYLIGQQVAAAPWFQEHPLEVIPTAYILVDGGKDCAVARVSNTKPIPQHDAEHIKHTAFAGQLSGKKIVYLEAGSGALHRVQNKLIATVRQQIGIPLLVGGGIRSMAEVRAAHQAGADMVVVGTALEEDNFVT